jgi:chain length determinant protein tyrosine kinase EpsG
MIDDLERKPAKALLPTDIRIGDALQRLGLINGAQAEEIAAHGRSKGLRFGEAAIALGMLSRDDLYRVLAEQFSATTPTLRGAVPPALFVASQPLSDAAEDFRTLRNTLALRWFKHPEGSKALAIISPNREDGRSTVAANLAVAFAQVGLRTLLIDADMRNPSQHKIFQLDDRYGLSGFLAGRSPGPNSLQIPGLEALTVMPVGGVPPNPQELLLRPTVDELFRTAFERFEVVLLDTPAAEAGSEYQLVAAKASGALVVSRRERTRVQSAQKLVRACSEFGTRMVGSILVDH